jgi:cytochrome P450
MNQSLPDMWNQQFINDPYPAYRQLLAIEGAIHTEGVWMLCHHADVQAALRHPGLGTTQLDVDAALVAQYGLEPIINARRHMMLFTNPPDHTRLRGLVSRAFTPRAVDRMRTAIEHLVLQLLDELDDGHIDLISRFAYPLPVTVIATMLGIPHDDLELFRRWSQPIAAFIAGSTETEADVWLRASDAAREMAEYFIVEARRRRAAPGDDLLTALAQAEDGGDQLSADELVANAILLLVAGHETTTNLIGNGMLSLLRHPQQLALLQQDPTLLGNAVEELLRYDSPVQYTERIALQDTTIGSAMIAEGETVQLFIGAANRDPQRYPDPDILDVQRADVRHLAFAHGAHFCLGAPLARLEARIAIGALLERAPRLALTDESLVWRPNFALRGLVRLPLVIGHRV